MVHITQLPYEQITYMLIHKDISIKDIMNFGMTCKKMYKVINGNNMLWRGKFFQRWPSLKEICNRKWQGKDVDIMQEVIYKIKCRQELEGYFSALYNKYYWREELSTELKCLDAIFRAENGAYPMKYYYLENELIMILNNYKKPEGINLMHVYYAWKILKYMKQSRLTDNWRVFINLPAQKQTLERAIAIMVQWCRLKVPASTTYMAVALDEIAKKAQERVREQNPTHPILSMCKKQLTFWKNFNIYENQWRGKEAKQILDVVHAVMREDFQMPLYRQSIFWPGIAINTVEEQVGFTLYTSIIFHGVARRLGIRCDILSLPPYFPLIWRESYATDIKNGETFFHIDVLNEGDVLHSEDDCTCSDSIRNFLTKHPMSFTITPVKLVLQLTNYFRSSYWLDGRKKCILEFQHMVDPRNVSTILKLGHFLWTHYINIDLTDFITVLLNALNFHTITNEEKENLSTMLKQIYSRNSIILSEFLPEPPKQRYPELKYAIGMIMKIRKNRANLRGVICGWPSKQIHDMIVEENDFNDNPSEPCYMLLTSNNETVSMAQEFLRPLKKTKFINNYEIGRYFSYFKKTHYIPNHIMEKSYPEDMAVRKMWLDHFRKSNVNIR